MNIQNLNRDKVKSSIEKWIEDNSLDITVRQFGTEFMNWYTGLEESETIECIYEETEDDLTQYDTNWAADMVEYFYLYVADYKVSCAKADAKRDADEAFRVLQMKKAFASAGLTRF